MKYRPDQSKQLMFDIYDTVFNTQKQKVEYYLAIGTDYSLDLLVNENVMKVGKVLFCHEIFKRARHIQHL